MHIYGLTVTKQDNSNALKEKNPSFIEKFIHLQGPSHILAGPGKNIWLTILTYLTWPCILLDS